MDPDNYRWARFALFLIFLIPSIALFLVIFILLTKGKEIHRKHLHNHVILALLCCNFVLICTELPFTLIYSYLGYAPSQTNQFCSFWVAYNYGTSVTGTYLMAFASIERYFLIFHDRVIRRWSLALHYLPIIFCCVYPLTFYNVVIAVYPCEPTYVYDAYVCGGSCFQFEPLIGTVDYMIHAVAPTCLIVLGNVILAIRFTYQKHSMQQANTWRKYRLMYVQLFSISALYFVIWIPFVTFSVIRLFYDPFFLQDLMILVFNYCIYICPLASPFIALIGLPAVQNKLIGAPRLLFSRNRVGTTSQVLPATSGMMRPEKPRAPPQS